MVIKISRFGIEYPTFPDSGGKRAQYALSIVCRMMCDAICCGCYSLRENQKKKARIKTAIPAHYSHLLYQYQNISIDSHLFLFG